MKKICLVVVLLAIVLISTSAIAQKADKELCLVGNPIGSTFGSQRTLQLSYTGLSRGHVIFYGESCYVIFAVPPNPEVRDCAPVIGSGILRENKLEFNVHGVEYMTSYGVGVFFSSQTHILLSLDTLTGTYAGEQVTHIEGIGGEGEEIFDTGSVAAVKCPVTSQAEIDADKQFQKMIKQIDLLGNE